MDERASLPSHPVPDEVRSRVGAAVVSVEGLVEHPAELTVLRLKQLPAVELEEPFVCEEGWQVPGVRWRGVRLGHVLALARPRAEARYVRVCSGDFVVPVPLEQADAAILADSLDGAPLTVDHGAPWRLVLPGAACFTSVKWVDRLVLAAEPGPNAGERIARARLTRAAGSGSSG